MNKRITFIISGILAILILGAAFMAVHNAMRPQKITILNDSRNNYEVTYYSSPNGQVTNTKLQLDKSQANKALLQNNSLFKPASYQIAVGNQNDRFYCIASIKQTAMGTKTKFINHQGHCSTYVAPNGQLAVVVGKTKH